MLRIEYTCPVCADRWVEEREVAGEGRCPSCQLEGITPGVTSPIPEKPKQAVVLTAEQDAIIDRVIAELNSALQADPVAITTLCGIRVPCNETLTNHPTVQVWCPPNACATVAVIGLLNSTLDAVVGSTAEQRDGNGFVAGAWNYQTGVLEKFVRYRPDAGKSLGDGRTLV